MPVYSTRMPAGIPGRVTRKSGVTLESVLLGAAMPFGTPGKIVNGALVPLAESDAADAVYGFLASPYPTQSSGTGFGAGEAPANTVQSVMRRGYMTVRLGSGTAAKNAPVHLLPSGLGGTGGKALANCTFSGAADEAGNVEIAYNI